MWARVAIACMEGLQLQFQVGWKPTTHLVCIYFAETAALICHAVPLWSPFLMTSLPLTGRASLPFIMRWALLLGQWPLLLIV